MKREELKWRCEAMNGPLKVLVVDDEILACEVVEKFLSNEGFATKSARSGEAAVDEVKTGWPDIVILDIRMPGMGGLEALRRIKEIAQECKVIMLTAQYDESTAYKAFDELADGFVGKPVALWELKQAIETALASGGNEEGASINNQ